MMIVSFATGSFRRLPRDSFLPGMPVCLEKLAGSQVPYSLIFSGCAGKGWVTVPAGGE